MALFVASALLAVAAGDSARAEDTQKDSGFTKRLFAVDISKQKKSYACFVRKYGALHLATHPLQKVSAMTLLVNAEVDPEDNSLSRSFRLGVKFRNRPGDFDSSGFCGQAEVSQASKGKEQMSCGVDCDGGGIAVEMGKTGGAVLVRLESIRIWRNNKPEDEGLDLSGGADDRVFRLDRAPLAMCRSLITDRKELAAMRSK
ncbi:MAG: hypothetical protein K2Z80_15615 [Xanthobacteraceae bacterium]|nr:hypothetical protein [Xanthobacteraceae bacterium]